MQIEKLIFTNKQWFIQNKKIESHDSVSIVFVFGDIDIVENIDHNKLLKSFYPNANIVVCSSSGNILDTSIDAYKAVATAIYFDSTPVKAVSKKIDLKNITLHIKELIDSLPQKDLKHVFFFAPGLVNGSELLDGIKLPQNVTISGGLAGDGYKFDHTYLRLNESAGEHLAIAVGLYGSSIHAKIGCKTGWEEFGTKRIVTKSHKNIVYEIDNKPAIKLYERYLGDAIEDLPHSALRFPVSVRDNPQDKNERIRVVMKVNRDKSLVFTGDIKEGSIITLMKTNIRNILDGASLSAQEIKLYNTKTSLTLTISCSARRSVLKQFSEEEIKIVQNILPPQTQIIGFYSYGEIAPFSNQLSKSLLHNHTMTITTIYEE